MNGSQKEFRSIWTFLSPLPHTLGYLEVDGVRTRYFEAGDPSNPTVLLLHGTAGSLENFCANYETLASRYHVLGIDMLGCGYTGKPEFDYQITAYAHHALAFLDAKAVRCAAVIGVSLGSWVAARMALDNPERVSAVIALAPAGIIVDADVEKEFGEDVRRRRSAAAAEPTWDSVTTAMGRLMLDPDDLIDDLVAVRLAIYQQESMKKAMPHLLAFSLGGNHLSHEQWASIEAPILVLASVDAPNMFLDNAYEIAKTAPHAELEEMNGCDHWPQFEQPARFHDLALGFLSRHLESDPVAGSSGSSRSLAE